MERAGRNGGWQKLAPGLDVLVHYERAWLRGDLVAGVTVAAYLVPQVMAYAEIAGLPAIAGLWAVLAPMVTYALLGSSRQLSIGPESTTALLTAAAIGALVGQVGAQRHAEVAAVLAIAVGIVCLVGWLGRVGFLANLLSKPVLVGYMAGIALLMIVSQFGKLTQLDISGSTPWEQTASLVAQLGRVHVPTLLLAAAVVGSLLAVRAWAPRWPGPLLAMLGAAAAVWLGGLERFGITLIGEVPRGLPVPSVPSLGSLSLLSLLPAALGIAVVGYTDNILTGRAFATKRGERIDNTQELLSLGAANVANGLFGGFPVSSSGSRTVLGDAAGSRTQLHSLVAAVMVVATIFVFSPVLAAFPVAALGGVVVYAAIRLIDVQEVRRIAGFRRSELVLALATFVAVLWTGVLPGIGIAVGLSLLDLIRRIANPHDGVLGYVPGLAGMHDIEDYPQATVVAGLLVYRYDSPLFFANAENFLSRAMAAVEATNPPPEWFVLNAEANIEVDLTAVDILEELRGWLTERGIIFAMSRVKLDVRDQLDAAGFIERVGADRIFPTLPTAVAAFGRWHQEVHGSAAAGIPEATAQPLPTDEEQRG
ncbi:MAG: sulfate permease [Propionicimonas sp.]